MSGFAVLKKAQIQRENVFLKKKNPSSLFVMTRSSKRRANISLK